MRKLYFYSSVLSLAAIFGSCDKGGQEIISASAIDKELEDALTQSSVGQGKSFYLMPESNELNKIPADPNNPLTPAKVELGKLLFHETGLGQNPILLSGVNTYSCASCHHAKAGFQACVPQGMGDGGIGFGQNGEGRIPNPAYKASQIDVQPIRTPSAMNMAYQTNILWNGQFGATHLNIGTEANWTSGTPKANNKLGFQGVETQAIAGRDVHRLVIDRIFIEHVSNYRSLYTQAFDAASINDPVKLKTNGALAIAAYERTLLSNQSPFQMWLKGSYGAMSEDEKKGALLFFGKAGCSGCHNGPSLANMEFYGLGLNNLKNGSYGNNEVININNGQPEHKGRGGFTGRAEDMFKFKVPQLYNLKDSPFYGHGATLTSVEQVINYKNLAQPENLDVPATQLAKDFKPLNLSEEEVRLLTLFVKESLYDPNLLRYAPVRLPSGLAFPVNDPQSRLDLGF